MLGLVFAGESLGVFEEELDGDDWRAMFVIGVAEVHGEKRKAKSGKWKLGGEQWRVYAVPTAAAIGLVTCPSCYPDFPA